MRRLVEEVLDESGVTYEVDKFWITGGGTHERLYKVK